MREIGVGGDNPGVESGLKLKGRRPFIGPNEVFFDGSEQSFGIRIPLWVVPGCENLFNFELRASLHEGGRGGLTSIVRDQFWLASFGENTVGKSCLDGHIEGR